METRYGRGEALVLASASPDDRITYNTTLYPYWIGESDCFGYVREWRGGGEYRLVNAAAATNELAFDHTALAQGLSQVTGETLDAKYAAY